MKKACLLDVNVLLALAWPEHEFHAIAHRWFSRRANRGWATCAITQAGFVRLSSNPRMSPFAVAVPQALRALTESIRHPQHEFWNDAILYAEAAALIGRDIVGHQQVTDAYLLGLAIHKQGIFATFDQRVTALLPSSGGRRDCIELIVEN